MKKPYNPKPLPEPIERDPVHGDTYEHESFGIITAQKHMGGGKRPMFGSKILHDASGTIEVEIKDAQYKRSLSNDWVFPRRTVVSVELTESQWASFISSPNQQGVPCTIRERWVFEGGKARLKSMEEPPFFEIVDQFDVELKERLGKVKSDTKEMATKLDAILAGKTVSKTELREIRNKLMTVLEYLPGNLEFVSEQFEEAMEKTVEEAKLAVETHIERTLHAVGLEGARQLFALTGTSPAQIPGRSDGEEK